MTHKRIKIRIKIGQTNERPISIEQFVALNVHTKQQYIKYLETNTWRNRTWVRILRVMRSIPRQPRPQSLFFISCVFPPQKSVQKKKLGFSSFSSFSSTLSHQPLYISPQPPENSSVQKVKSPFPFFFLYLYQPPKNLIY